MTQPQQPSSPPSRFCPNCGTSLSPQAGFCPQCGTAAPQAPRPAEPPPQQVPRPSGPPPQPVPRPSAAFNTPGTHVPNYLVQSILVTIFCCTPIGLVSLVFAAQVNGKLGAGDYAGALETSNKAKTWAWVSFWVGLPLAVLAILLGIFGAGA